MRTSPGAEIERRSSSGAQIERWNSSAPSAFNAIDFQRIETCSLGPGLRHREPGGAVRRDLLSTRSTSTNLLATREQCMNTLQNYQQINEHLTQITNAYDIFTETWKIYKQSLYNNEHLRNPKSAHADTQTIPEICQALVPSHPGTNYPAQGIQIRGIHKKVHAL